VKIVLRLSEAGRVLAHESNQTTKRWTFARKDPLDEAGRDKHQVNDPGSPVRIRYTVIECLTWCSCECLEGGRLRKSKASLNFTLHEDRCTLESLVAILVVDCLMMRTWMFAAFEQQVDERPQLREGIA
jgi:hypothetical protein